jgi:hypothetical protein
LDARSAAALERLLDNRHPGKDVAPEPGGVQVGLGRAGQRALYVARDRRSALLAFLLRGSA